MTRPIQCPDCGARLDAFGICPNASPQDVRTMHGFASCGRGHYLTPLSVWSALAACAAPDQPMGARALPANRADTAQTRHGPKGPIAA
ncbi:MAG: hypothetical protein ABR956_06760 [Terracidiphilus sp.]